MERQTRVERRKAQRKIRRLPISYSDGQKEHSGISSDFSLEGLFIRTRNALPPGTPLKMVLEVGQNQKINLAGLVIWSVKTGIMDFKNGMGVKITSKPTEYTEFILNLLG
ncbi:MAG: PilZ domain-containing protein [Nitrospirae bacterium]|nr:PilZ domain-containing protein [Nitrospirota bacterium]